MRRPVVGLAAALIVATSPAMLFMLVAPMSDVPAAAAWAVAVAFLISGAPLASGIATAIAILIRPNLVPLAGILFLYCVITARSWRALRFAAAAACGAIGIGIVNSRLYGSAFASGYGDLTTAFSWSFVLPNLARYPWWLITADTPLALAGLVALAVPARRLWPTPEARRTVWLLAAVAAAIWISYIVYVPWDAWWYLRFLLPTWPMMAIGTASIASVLYRRGGRAQLDAMAMVLLEGASGIAQAVQRNVFEMADGEAKHIEVARVVETLSSPDDVIVSMQHSGSLRYYAERLTLRWDFIEPEWLDDAVRWLDERGHHVYLLLEEGEAREFTGRFASRSALAQLDWTPLVTFRGGSIALYDLTRPGAAAPPTEQAPLRALNECPPQRPFPRLR